ncbi:MAG TPA: RNA degradosome polyphosphate kinase [Bacillota bacterium]|nr:RNA degradosome polyphosphate kinase [Bacillota bacterium]HPE38604.1 RNA degradosome polyphosphate kinase [Bacillota bacterium]
MTKEKGKKKSVKDASEDSKEYSVTDSTSDNGLRYFNRELSWLEFNNRILHEARDTKNPLLERIKFLSITCSNMDEFFIVRVASLRDMLSIKYNERDISGRTVKDQLTQINAKSRESMSLLYSTYSRSIVPSLRAHGIHLMNYDELDYRGKELADEYFHATLYPILTPMAVDASRPFPLINNRQLNLCALIRSHNELSKTHARDEKDGLNEHDRFTTIQIPAVVPRLFELHLSTGISFIPIEQIIRANLKYLFSGAEVIASGFYRVMRNADLDIDEDEAEDLLKEIEEQVRRRRFGEIIRMEINDNTDKRLLSVLKESLHIAESDIFEVSGPIDLTFLMKVYSRTCNEYPSLCYPQYVSAFPQMFTPGENIFDAIRQKDRLVHHPYEAFDPVIEFVRQAAEDPNVLAIKQTLYRVSSSSPIIHYLAEAAQNGKQVMVLVELKARFDEENNINWAKMLEKAGCHVIYGLVGLKTHSKITLVVRNEEEGIRRYLHLATGNYNDITAKIYTDIGLFTASETFGVDASEFFNMLSGYSEPPEWKRLIPAPLWMKNFFLKKIGHEAQNARDGKPAKIIAKMNSLVDAKIIDALYDASCAGVQIQLIIRGICCLRPGVKGLSENIEVRSITGRFLEHSRIYYFFNEGLEDIYLSSADWMPRNLDRRVELLFPVEDEDCKARCMEVLHVELADNVRSSFLDANGNYHKMDLRGKHKVDSQEELQMHEI